MDISEPTSAVKSQTHRSDCMSSSTMSKREGWASALKTCARASYRARVLASITDNHNAIWLNRQMCKSLQVPHRVGNRRAKETAGAFTHPQVPESAEVPYGGRRACRKSSQRVHDGEGYVSAINSRHRSVGQKPFAERPLSQTIQRSGEHVGSSEHRYSRPSICSTSRTLRTTRIADPSGFRRSGST